LPSFVTFNQEKLIIEPKNSDAGTYIIELILSDNNNSILAPLRILSET